MRRNAGLIVLLLTFGLAISGCASNGGVVQCPVLPPIPASLMVEPTFEQQARQTLFEPEQKPTTGSSRSNPPAE